MSTLIKTTLIALSSLAFAGAAHAACNYAPNFGTNCGNAVSDYMQQTIGSSSNPYDGIPNRVNSLGSTVRECGNCTLDYIDRNTGGSSTSTSTSTFTDDDNN